MMIMMMMIFWGHSSCFIGLQERCAWSQSPVLRQSIVFCGEDGSMWDSTLPMNQPVEDPNWSHKSTGPCLNLFNGSCDSRILIDLDHSNPFLRCCQISGYRDILRHCGRWVLNHSAPSFWKRPLHRSSSIWFVLNLDTQGFPTQGTSEHLKVLVLVGFGVQVIPVLILVYLWFIYLLLCCRRVALRGKKTAGSWPQVQRRPFDIVSQHENVPDVDGSKPMTWLNQHPSTSQKNHPGARVLSHTQIWYDLHQFTTKEPQIFVALFIQSFAW